MAQSHDPIAARSAACDIVRTLRANAHVALLAGGCVRDELLGLRPTDFDVATSATPQQLRSLFPRTHAVGESFGVMLVAQGDVIVEVATFRSDGAYTDKRRPDSIEFSDAQRDAARRDFTINALFLDPLIGAEALDTNALPGAPVVTHLQSGEGRVIDYVSGLADLRTGILRAVGIADDRLAEDHLRALRGVRFSARLGFAIEPSTAAAIRRHASELAGISRERIGEELRRMLAHPARAQAVTLLHELGLDAPVLTEPALGPRPLPTLIAIGQPPPLVALVHPQPPVPVVLAAWMLDRGLKGHDDAAILRWRKALCLSNDERDQLVGAMRSLDRLKTTWPGASVASQKRLAGAEWFHDALRLLATQDRPLALAIERRYEELARTPSGIAPQPLVTGDDLVAMGLRPGAHFKRILDAVYDAQLEDRLTEKAAGLSMAAKHAQTDAADQS